MSPATLLNSHLASHSLTWASSGQAKQTRNHHLEQTSDYLSSNCYENRTQERAAACFSASTAGSDCWGMRWHFHLAVDHRARWCQVAWTVGKKLEHLWPPIQALISLLKSLGCPSLEKNKNKRRKDPSDLVWDPGSAVYVLVILSKMLYLCWYGCINDKMLTIPNSQCCCET